MALKDTASDALTDAQAFVDSHRDEGTTELFGITELCREFGITLRALRFYEDKGLLAPRRVNGARVYTRRDRARLALILRAKAIGSPLSEIKTYLDLYGDHGEGRAQQLQYVITRTDNEITELEKKRANRPLTHMEYARAAPESGANTTPLRAPHLPSKPLNKSLALSFTASSTLVLISCFFSSTLALVASSSMAPNSIL
jgi:DNA-binding transcriptional MerR regulator